MYRAAMQHAPEAARSTLGGALAVAETLPKGDGANLLRESRAAFVHAMELTSAIETAIVVAMAIFAITVLRRPAVTARPEETADHGSNGAAASRADSSR